MVNMSFFDFIKKFFAPRRNISRLRTSADGDIDTVEEIVDVAGGPLKEHHRRRALRDGRLLPGKPHQQRSFVTGKRKKIFSALDAGRLFSPTLRTQDRNIRDLLADEDQLMRYNLPLWHTEEGLAQALGISVATLRFFSIHRERDKVRHYVTFAIKKKKGGERLIMAPCKKLKAIQRKLCTMLVDRLPVSEHAHGFRKKRSIASGAAPHVGRRVVLHMDLKDFFPTVHFGRVRGYLIALGYGYPVATVLAVLMTEAERQPVEVEGCLYHVPVSYRYCVQGAPTSPGLCNALVLRMDRRLAGTAKAAGFTYTRYADDLTFSGDDEEKVITMRFRAERIIREEGFQVHREKTRIMRRGGAQKVTGVTVNEVAGLSRKERRKLRAMAHQLLKARSEGKPDLQAERRLSGKLAYLSMLNTEQAEAIRKKMQ
jgi:RNA-directed DNA polymerase